jgi:hypothetical protein
VAVHSPAQLKWRLKSAVIHEAGVSRTAERRRPPISPLPCWTDPTPGLIECKFFLYWFNGLTASQYIKIAVVTAKVDTTVGNGW